MPRTGWGIVLSGVLVCLTACTPRGPRSLLEGERLIELGRPVDAIRPLRVAVEFLPGNAQAWNHLGLAYHLAGRPGEAASAYLQATRLDPRLAVAPYNLGCLWLEQGDPSRAANALRSHLNLQPRSLDGWRKLGQAQLRLAQWDLAEGSFSEALRLSPGDSVALNGLGVSHQQRRRAREAWQCFTAATTQDPDFAPAWLNLGVAALYAGSPGHAQVAFQHYLDLRPKAALALGVDAQLAALKPRPAPPSQTDAGTAPVPIQSTSIAAASNSGLSGSLVHSAGPPTEVVTVASATHGGSPPSTRRLSPPPTHDGPPDSDGLPSSTPTRVPEPQSRTSVPPQRVIASAPVVPPSAPAAPATVLTSTSPPPVQMARAPTQAPLVATLPAGQSPPTNLTLTVPIIAAPAETSLPSRTDPPPLVRSVEEQQRTLPARRGFWERANPVRWFSSDSEEPRPADESPDANRSRSGSRWDWANPARWFRSDRDEDDSTVSGDEAVQESVPTSAPLLTEPTIRVVASTPAAERVSGSPTAAPVPPVQRPASTPSTLPARDFPVSPRPIEPRRYAYLDPAIPPAGDRRAARPFLEQALLDHRRGRLDAAISQYGQALRVDPASVEAYQNLAAIYLQRGDLRRALALGEAALKIRPEAARTRLNFALALDRAGFPADAAEQADRILATNPDDADAHLLLGNLYSQQLDQPQQARRHYLKVIDLNPQHPESIAIRRWLAGRP